MTGRELHCVPHPEDLHHEAEGVDDARLARAGEEGELPFPRGLEENTAPRPGALLTRAVADSRRAIGRLLLAAALVAPGVLAQDANRAHSVVEISRPVARRLRFLAREQLSHQASRALEEMLEVGFLARAFEVWQEENDPATRERRARIVSISQDLASARYQPWSSEAGPAGPYWYGDPVPVTNPDPGEPRTLWAVPVLHWTSGPWLCSDWYLHAIIRVDAAEGEVYDLTETEDLLDRAIETGEPFWFPPPGGSWEQVAEQGTAWPPAAAGESGGC